eukprot:GEZU01001382.1.p2 GENE.GEZU01001382.1~~GEZU01001382.1.p2  ORF type:complete len:191 (+),score=46.00 GEZU01001382.1:66-575(+)
MTRRQLIFAVGGTNGNAVYDTMEYFDPLSSSASTSTTSARRGNGCSSWTMHPARMCTPRYGHALVALDGVMYAIGGANTYNQFIKSDMVLDSVERFDPAKGIWEPVAPMNTKRFAASACATNGFIFVFGGHDGNRCLCTVEKYNPKTNTWTAQSSTTIFKCMYRATCIY